MADAVAPPAKPPRPEAIEGTAREVLPDPEDPEPEIGLTEPVHKEPCGGAIGPTGKCLKCGERFPALVQPETEAARRKAEASRRAARARKESASRPRDLTDEEAREAERNAAERLTDRERGRVSTVQGRVVGLLEQRGGEATLAQLLLDMPATPEAEVKKALGDLLREAMVRPHRVGPELRYRLNPTG